MRRTHRQTQAELGMLLVAFIWGITFVLVKNALADIGPYLFLGVRFILAFIILAVISNDTIKMLTLPTLRDGAWLGFFLLIGYGFQTVGLQYTTAANAGFITGLSVVLVPLLYAALNRTLPTTATMGTVILAAAGLYLLSVPAGSFQLAYGDLLVLVCACAFACHIVFVDRLSHQHHSSAITGVQILFVGIVCLLLGLLYEPFPAVWTKNALVAIFITAVFATTLAFLLQNSLQHYSTPTRIAIILTAEPVFAAMAGYLWAGETFDLRSIIGAGLILLAMLLSVLTQRHR
ncbi:MAG TPA: DMT family transporter [Syntrophomonadaceae bacterium]|nr:DMT family transporter [Syntrophomonadaceae bacterium]